MERILVVSLPICFSWIRGDLILTFWFYFFLINIPDTMWSIVQVKECGTLALNQQLLALRASNIGSSTTQSEAESMEVSLLSKRTFSILSGIIGLNIWCTEGIRCNMARCHLLQTFCMKVGIPGINIAITAFVNIFLGVQNCRKKINFVVILGTYSRKMLTLWKIFHPAQLDSCWFRGV